MTAHAASGTTFYVSNKGKDEDAGTSESTAWATIPRVQQAIDSGELKRGDTVVFHAGHRFYGQFTSFDALQGEGRLTFGAYGSGDRPQIMGYKILNKPTAWRNLGRNRWQLQPDDLITHCADLNVTIESWSPLGQARDLENPTVVQIAERLGATPAQVVIRWHMDRGFVVIPKSKTPERIISNFEALKVSLTAEDRAAIDALNADNRIGPDPATLNE